jgi:hypothetical protein
LFFVGLLYPFFLKKNVFLFFIYAGVLVLIDLFRSEIENICAIRSSVLTADETGDIGAHQGVLSCMIFETLEVLLLFSGPMLTTTMREDIENSVGKGE